MSQAQFENIPLKAIRPSPTNPRKHFDKDAMKELAESIREHGVAQPILVRPVDDKKTPYEIVAGERRFRASKDAGKDSIPAVIKTLPDNLAREIQVIENLQREDLHPLEEAEGYELLMKENNMSADDLANKVGKSKGYIYQRLRLTSLSKESRKAFMGNKFNLSVAFVIARVPNLEHQKELLKDLLGYGEISVSNAKRTVTNKYMLQLGKARFKTADPDLLPKAGSCSTCPKRTGNQPEIFEDIESTDTCTDLVCFREKNVAHVSRIKAEAIKKGQKIISGVQAKKINPYSYSTDRLEEGYINLDSTSYEFGANGRTYRKILGRTLPQPILLESPHDNGLIIEVLHRDTLRPLLEEKGVSMRAQGKDSIDKAREREQREKQKIDREYRLKVFDTIREKPITELSEQLLRHIAMAIFNRSSDTRTIIRVYDWPKDTDSYPDRYEKVEAQINAIPTDKLPQFILDAYLSHDIPVGFGGSPARLEAIAEKMGIDAAGIKKAIEDEFKAKQKAKTAKKSAKTAKGKSHGKA